MAAQFEAFRAAAESAVALLERGADPPDGKEPDLKPGQRGLLRRLVDGRLADRLFEGLREPGDLAGDLAGQLGDGLLLGSERARALTTRNPRPQDAAACRRLCASS